MDVPDELKRIFEVMLYDEIAERDGQDIPEEAHTLVRCLVFAGCPMKNVLKGLSNFAEKMIEEDDLKSLKELCKDLPIKWEDD